MQKSQISARPAQLAIVGIIAYQFILIALIFIRPDIDPYSHTLSEWAIGKHGWIMSLAFLISATSYSALLIAIRSQARGIVGRIGQGLLLLCAIGIAGAGLFTTDPFDAKTLSTTGTLHMISAFGSLMLFPFAALLISLSLAFKNTLWSPVRPIVLWTGSLPLLGLIGFWLHLWVYVIPLGDNAHGPDVPLGYPVRILFLTYMVWLVTLAWQSIQRQNTTKHANPFRRQQRSLS